MTTNDGFKFRPPPGEPSGVLEWGSIVFDGTITRRGRRMIRFPAPYRHITIVEDERVSTRKWSQIQAAVAALLRGTSE